MPGNTKLTVSHQSRDPEKKELWWFNKTSAVIVAVCVTILMAIVNWPNQGSPLDDWGTLISFVFITSVLSNLICLGYIAIGAVATSSLNDNRFNYSEGLETASWYTIATPWVVSIVALVGLVIVAVVIGIIIVFALMAGLANS
jgi:hypothetical protein